MDTEASIEWKAQQADAWLRDARNMWKECARLQAMARDAREMADGLRAVRYDTIGGGSGMAHGDDAIAARLVRLESIEQRYAWATRTDTPSARSGRAPSQACGSSCPPGTASRWSRPYD